MIVITFTHLIVLLCITKTVHNHPDEIFLRLRDYQVKLPTDNEIVESVIRNNSQARVNDIVKQEKPILTDPINAFYFVKDGLYREKTIKNILRHESATLKQLRSLEEIVPLGEEDLINVAKQIFSLQSTYNLSSSYFTDGLEGPTYCAKPLKIFPIFQIALIACNLKRNYHCLDWMANVDQKKTIDWDPRVLLHKQLDAMGLPLLLQGNLKRAWLVSRQLSILLPNNEGPRKNVVQLKRFLKGDELKDLDYAPPLNNRLTGDTPLNRLCRNQDVIPFYKNSTAICYHQRQNYISKFKVEVAYPSPLIRIFYDVLNDTAIERLKTLSSNSLQRGKVFNSFTGKIAATTTRISMTANLMNSTDQLLKRVDDMVEDMTGLDARAGEALSVINYGVGGLYKAHHDFPLNASFANPETGRRILTALFYLSTPYKGGATVFTKLNIYIPPTKGSALVWYNLNDDGTGDMRTQHAGCAVLSGEKWITNKWIYERGQEFRRKCTIPTR